MTDTIWCPSLNGAGPKYAALAESIRASVETGELGPGAKLPPVRDLAYRLGVTPGTVARAYRDLTEAGVLDATVGRGTFVAARRDAPAPPHRLVQDLPSGHVDLKSANAPDVGQREIFAGILHQIADDPSVDMCRYGHPSDDRGAVEAMRGWVCEREIGPVEAGDLVLVAGAQNGLVVVMQTLMADRPRVALTEELSYSGYRHAAGLAGMRLEAVPMDAEGPVPEAIEAVCRRCGPAVLCTSSEVQNPTTRATSAERCAKIAEIARAHDMHIVDDCTFHAAGARQAGYRALAPERVWHLASLSKVISPALRFGALVAPSGWGARALTVFQNQSFGLPRVSVELCRRLIDSGAAGEIRARVADVTGRRLAIARRVLGGHDLESRGGVPFVWLTMPAGWRASTFTSAAEALGIQVRAADTFALIGGGAPNAVRLSLNSAQGEAELERALGCIADLLSEPRQSIEV